MWKQICTLLVIIEVVLGAPHLACPEVCTCHYSEDNSLELNCSSFQFISKLGPKQYSAISSLTLNNLSIDKIDPKLKYLKNLKYLDLSNNEIALSTFPQFSKLKTLKLSGNNLKAINISNFPENLTELDISHNYLAQIPKDWTYLKALKTLHIFKNPIDCECNNVLVYEGIIQHGITIPNSIKCHSPPEYSGKLINTINCSIVSDLMLYDDPEGSGASNINDFTSDEDKIPIINEEDENIGSNNNITLVEKENFVVSSTSSTVETVEEYEGSGTNEGSGFGAIILDLPKACTINCSTPKPVGQDDEKHASPSPDLVVQAEILFNDIKDVFKDEVTTTTTTTTTEKALVPVDEHIFVKEFEPQLGRESDKSDAELIATNDKVTGELERASVVTESSNTVYTIVGVCIIILICVLIFVLRRRKTNQERRRQTANDFGEEMKSLGKPMIKPINDTPTKKPSLSIPENIPLINGQNGKIVENVPQLRSFKGDSDEYLNDDPDVIIREKPIPELLTPQRERVTIKETEIPDSIPKTPMLVHRQRNSDGEIVTTVVPS